MEREELNRILELHEKWRQGREDGIQLNLKGADLIDADLIDADLRKANLRGADLRDADLRGADPDFSVLPLWCGGLGIIVDARIARQIAYHFCSLECEDEEFIEARNAILDFANKFHRVEECGVLERR